MLAIDVPISILAGLTLAEAGRGMLESGDREKYNFMRSTVLLYSVFFITPVVFYFFMGWPAWEVNFLWRWTSHVQDSPLRVGTIAFGAFILTVGPSYAAFKIGKLLTRKGIGWWLTWRITVQGSLKKSGMRYSVLSSPPSQSGKAPVWD